MQRLAADFAAFIIGSFAAESLLSLLIKVNLIHVMPGAGCQSPANAMKHRYWRMFINGKAVGDFN